MVSVSKRKQYEVFLPVSRPSLPQLTQCHGPCVHWRCREHKYTSGLFDRRAPRTSGAVGRSSCPGSPAHPPACAFWRWLIHSEALSASRSKMPDSSDRTLQPLVSSQYRSRRGHHSAPRRRFPVTCWGWGSDRSFWFSQPPCSEWHWAAEQASGWMWSYTGDKCKSLCSQLHSSSHWCSPYKNCGHRG